MKLELISVDSKKSPIVLHQFPVIVGLDPGADVCLDDSSVGHYQCMIDQSDGELMVWDLGTRSGTLVNGVRVSPKAPLRSGDELSFGKHCFIVRHDAGPVRPLRSTREGRAASRESASSPRRRQPVAQV